MGAVYEAEQLATGKRVAIKWLHPHVVESRSAVERLVREAQASARVRHPHVVDVYDVEREGETLFLVMEYLEGETLASLLERGSVPFHQVLSVIVQAMRGVAEAHRQGIVHRDIKPENIFLSTLSDTTELHAKVLDFGISKLDQPGGLSLTQTGSALGTPLYMSYEQLSGARDVDGRSDIYAFGVILYEALTGMLPYTADNFAELAAKVITTEPPTPRQLRPEIPEALEQIVLWAMQKRRDDRPANMGVLIDALLPFTVVPRGRASLSSSVSSSSIQPVAHAGRSPSIKPPGEFAERSTDRPPPGAYGTSSRPPPPQHPGAPAPSQRPTPSLRLDGQDGDWDEVLDRNQRSRREMEDSVTALIAGTMPEYERNKPAASRGLWMGIGALTTLAGGIALASFLLGDRPTPTARPTSAEVAPTNPTPAAAPAPANASPAASAAAVQSAPTQPAAEPSLPDSLPAAAPTQVEPVRMETPEASVIPTGKDPPAVAPGKGSTPHVVHPTPAPQVARAPAKGSNVWHPSGETSQPPVVHQEVSQPQPQPPPQPEQPKPEAPPVLEVPGTAPNPFVEGEDDKYRAGRPSEDQF